MDLSIRLLRDGYQAVSKDRRARDGGATYASRLMGRRTVVLGDAAGAKVFYDESLVRRTGAVPPPLAWLLFGRGIGIDHHPEHWPQPNAFRPQRFLDDQEFSGRVAGAFELVPQGGGHPSGHRCPGESVALRLLMVTVGCLAQMDYEVPGSTDVDLSRIPTLPTHGLRLTEVRVPAAAR